MHEDVDWQSGAEHAHRHQTDTTFFSALGIVQALVQAYCHALRNRWWRTVPMVFTQVSQCVISKDALAAVTQDGVALLESLMATQIPPVMATSNSPT